MRKMKETPIQGGVLHYIDAVELVEMGASRARLRIKQEYGKAVSYNVIARIQGSDRADEVLTLTAHYDSVPAGKGAYDNMAGAAIIMELCRYFSRHQPRRTMEFIWFGAEEKGLVGSRNYVTVHEKELKNHVIMELCRYFSRHQPRRTMEFIWFGAEEKGLVGSRNYVTVHEKELKNHVFNMNVDLAGQLVGGTVVGVTGDVAICHMLEYMAHEVEIGMVTKHSIWGSDSNSFAWKGVPAMTLNRDGFGMHTRHDTLEYISPWSLQRSAQLLGYIGNQLGNIPVMPFKKEIPEEFKRELEEYFKRLA